MIARKKSLQQYHREKLIREGKPLFSPRKPYSALNRKSAMGRHPEPQGQQHASQRARAPLRRVSAKRAKENREYTKRRKEFLSRHRWCVVYPYEPATEVHHKDGREGSLLNQEELWLAVSRRGHEFIHQHPNEARKRGWLV